MVAHAAPAGGPGRRAGARRVPRSARPGAAAARRRRRRRGDRALEALLAAKPEHGQALIALGDARLIDARSGARAGRVRARAEAPARAIRRRWSATAWRWSRSASYEPAITLARPRGRPRPRGDRGILADAYRGLGIAWRRRGDLDKAIRELRKAVVEDGEDLDARAALGEALVADGRTATTRRLRGVHRGVRGAAPPRARAAADARRRSRSTRWGGWRWSRAPPRSPPIGSGRARAIAERDLDPARRAGPARHPDRAGRRRARGARRARRARLLPRGAAGRAAPGRAPRPRRRRPTARSATSTPRSPATSARSRWAPALDTLRAAVDTAIAAGDPLRQARVGERPARRGPDRRPRDRRARRRDGRRSAGGRAGRCSSSPPRATTSTPTSGSPGSRSPATPPRAPASALAALRVAPHHGTARQLLTEAARRAGSARPARRRTSRELARVPREARRRSAASSATWSATSRARPRTSISRCSSP